MSMHTQIGKWGNNLAVRLPRRYAKELGLAEGMNLEVTVVNGGLLLSPHKDEYSLEELVARITAENLHEETAWGPAMGQESW